MTPRAVPTVHCRHVDCIEPAEYQVVTAAGPVTLLCEKHLRDAEQRGLVRPSDRIIPLPRKDAT